MSMHRPGDVAPLPSPTSMKAPSEHYFPPLGPLAEQPRQTSNHPQEEALLQAQQAQRMREASFAQQQNIPRQSLGTETQHCNTQEQSQNSSSQRLPQAQEQIGIWARPQDQQRQNIEYTAGQSMQHQPRQLSGSSTDSDASTHLRDFSLLAEAAKRAQVAVVTRDLEDVSL